VTFDLFVEAVTHATASQLKEAKHTWIRHTNKYHSQSSQQKQQRDLQQQVQQTATLKNAPFAVRQTQRALLINSVIANGNASNNTSHRSKQEHQLDLLKSEAEMSRQNATDAEYFRKITLLKSERGWRKRTVAEQHLDVLINRPDTTLKVRREQEAVTTWLSDTDNSLVSKWAHHMKLIQARHHVDLAHLVC
jgi:hypothetical protein